MLGGADYSQSQFNRVNQMKRQPGSIFKPFVYLSALESGMHPTDMFEDKLTAIADWMPRNHDNKYIGPVNMETALEKSLNTVPVQIAKRIGLKNIIATAQKLGLVDKLSNDYSIILGTSETTLMDLTSAYATFANSGLGVIPHAITKITTGDGTIIYKRNGSGVGTLVSQQASNDMNQMLRKVILGGTGVNANIPGELLYGKTGTSQNNRDAWFIGYTPKYITGVWVGNDDNTAMSDSSYGGIIPAKIFKTIMTYIISNTEL
jgi:penicillin-binding protein 1A